MANQFESLDDVFNVTSEVMSKEVEPIKAPLKKVDSLVNEIRKDYEYSRGNYYSIIEKGQEAINSILELAQESESPRAYEVVSQLIKNVSDATDKLMDLQQKLKDIEEVKHASGPTNVTNALFVGSTAELSKLLKAQKEQPESK